MTHTQRTLALSFALLCSSTSMAATVTASMSKEGKEVLALSGEIMPGDAEQVRALIKVANDAGRIVSGIRLDSAGGNLGEAVVLANLIKYGKIASIVPNGARCASACFLIFAAGLEKYASHSAWVGVHGASDQNGRETAQSGAATISMARVARDFGVPAGIIGKMVVTPPEQMVWLSADDLRSMGATMTGKPAQVPNEVQAAPWAPQAPAQLPPSSSGNNVANANTQTWRNIVDIAVEQSKKQNNGQIQFTRGCQPELKICTTGIHFNEKNGRLIIVKSAEELSGKIINRGICEFNDFRDVRSCWGWDKGVMHKDMKDNKGTWNAVAQD